MQFTRDAKLAFKLRRSAIAAECLTTQGQDILFLNVSFNYLSGTLSESLCNTSKALQYFAVNNNDLHGTIPLCFGSLNRLNYLLLSYNQFKLNRASFVFTTRSRHTSAVAAYD